MNKRRNNKFYSFDHGIVFDFPWGSRAIFFFKDYTPNFEIIFPKQKHTSCVLLYPDEFGNGNEIFFDGIISFSDKVALGVKTADCLPIAFSTPDLIGIIHAGWRGLAKGIIQELTQKIESLGQSMSSSYFVIGPHICGRCYNVGNDVAEIFEKLCKENNIRVNKVIRKRRKDGEIFIDLAGFACSILRNLGAKKVFVSKICVKEDKRFFSRRRGDNHSQISVILFSSAPRFRKRSSCVC
jgi:YfiH family protein